MLQKYLEGEKGAHTKGFGRAVHIFNAIPLLCFIKAAFPHFKFQHDP